MNTSARAATPLEVWEELSVPEAEQRLLACCGSHRWARTLVSQRPFDSAEHLLYAAGNLWFLLDEGDWLEAFACHPRIGERKAAGEAEVQADAGFRVHSAAEQAAALATLDGVGDALAAGNRAYEERFGFVYLVYANGRTAPELLEVLEHRLGRDRGTELQEAARQQHLITTLRLRRWLDLDDGLGDGRPR